MTQYWHIGIRCAIGLVFLVSSVSKVTGRNAFTAFTDSARRLGSLPAPLAGPVAAAVVAAEFAVWILLVLPGTAAPVAGLLLAVVLLLGFAVAALRAIRRGVGTPCRCFGGSATRLGPRHVVRNFLLAAAAATAVAATPARLPAQPGALVMALFAGLLAGGLIVLLDDLVGLFAKTAGLR
ncbi:MauE/DoxX family redox-associated membrane protein [Amycolatopsis lurida]